MITETVAQVAQKVTGSRWNVEGTGGGCEALTTILEGGIVLVVEQNLCVPEWSTESEFDLDWTLGAFGPEAWAGDSDYLDPIACDLFVSAFTPETFTAAIGTLLAALPALVRL